MITLQLIQAKHSGWYLYSPATCGQVGRSVDRRGEEMSCHCCWSGGRGGEGPPIRDLQNIPAQSSLTFALPIPELPEKGLDWCLSVISFFLFFPFVNTV